MILLEDYLPTDTATYDPAYEQADTDDPDRNANGDPYDDVSPYLQRAIDAASAARGKLVLGTPAGASKYRAYSPVYLRDNVLIECEPGFVLEMRFEDVSARTGLMCNEDPAVAVENLHLRGGTFTAEVKDGKPRSARIFPVTLRRSSLVDVTVGDYAGNAYNLAGEDVVLDRCRALRPDTEKGGGTGACRITQGDRITVVNGHFISGDDALQMVTGRQDVGGTEGIRDCSFVNNYATSAYARGMICGCEISRTASVRRGLFIGNIVVGDQRVMQVQNSGSQGFIEDVKFIGNDMTVGRNPGGRSIAIDVTTESDPQPNVGHVRNILLQGNTIRGYASTAIRVRACGEGVVLDDNHLIDPHPDFGEQDPHGVIVVRDTPGVQIKGGLVTSRERWGAIRLGRAGSPANGALVSNVRLLGYATSGVLAQDSDGALIEGCQFEPHTGEGTDVCVHNRSSTNVLAVGNSMLNVTTTFSGDVRHASNLGVDDAVPPHLAAITRTVTREGIEEAMELLVSELEIDATVRDRILAALGEDA